MDTNEDPPNGLADGPANDNAPVAMTPVASEALSEVGHDPRSRTLFVRFRSGELYAYLDVPADVAEAFLLAPSKGRFFQAEIDPVFRYVRVDPPGA